MNAAAKAFNEQMIRTQSYMIESQSSGLAAGWASEDGVHVLKNIGSAADAVKAIVESMACVIDGAKTMQVDGDQIAIDGYSAPPTSPNTT